MEIAKEVEVYRRLYSKVVSKISEDKEVFYTTIKVGKEFEKVEVCDLCYPSKFFEDDEGRVKVQATFKKGKEWKRCFVDVESKQTLMKSLYTYGFVLINNDNNLINIFATHFLNLYKVLTGYPSSKLVGQLGWQPKKRDFALGNEYIAYVEKDGKNTYEIQECEVHDSLDSLNKTMKVAGSEEVFKNQINALFELDLPKHHAYFLLGVSTPALGLIKRQGTIINFQSTQPSIGKSLIQKCIKLCYMDNVQLTNGFTYNAIIEDIRKHNNFPVFIEELSKMIREKPEEVVQFIHAMTGGISKLRSTESGKNRDANTFATSLLTTSNPDIFTIIDSESDAELVRTLQIQVSQEEANYIKENKLQIKLGKIKDMLEKHHGHGRTFILNMLKTNYEEIFHEEYESLIEKHNFDDFRYVGFVIANAITFALLLEGMGYSVNVEEVRETFAQIIKELKQCVNSKKITGHSTLERIMSMLPIQHFKKQGETGGAVTDDNYPLVLKHDGQIINGETLVIPKDIFDEKVCNNSKSKGRNLINLSSREVLEMFKNEGIYYETKQKRYSGGNKITCVIITLPSSIKR